MRKVESLEVSGLSEFDRMIPKEGLLILPGVLYIDVNDVRPDERLASRKMFYEDEEYQPLYLNRKAIWKGGNLIGRRYCAYVYKDGSYVGNVVYTEKLDNPHGYGKDDFTITKWICKPYRRTKYSRYASGDLNHMLFRSGVVKRLYTYIRLIPEDPGSGLWTRIDFSMPCIGKLYDTDGPKVQKYISIKNSFQTPNGKYAIMELDGEIYRNMDLIEYLVAGGPNRTRESMEEMLICMDNAAEVVKRTIGGAINE
jgi:hypothetical protein